MKIALTGPDPTFRGGIGQYNHFLASSFLNAGDDLLFAGFTRQYPSWLYPAKDKNQFSELSDPGYPVTRILDYRNPYSAIKAADIIREFGAERVIIPWWTSFWWVHTMLLLHRLRDIPVTVIAHNVMPHSGSRLAARLTDAVLRKAQHVIVQSQEEKAALDKKLPSPATLFYHPPYPQFAPRETKEEARKLLGIEENQTVILFFGTLRFYKGPDIFAEALTLTPEITGVIAGGFWEKELETHIKSLAASHSNIKLFEGYQNDDQSRLLFSACDAVVLPYRSVTGSGVAMAAAGARKPVIAADHPLFRDVFSSSGIFFEKESPLALADSMQSFSARNTSFSTDHGILYSDKFSWDNLASTIRKLN